MMDFYPFGWYLIIFFRIRLKVFRCFGLALKLTDSQSLFASLLYLFKLISSVYFLDFILFAGHFIIWVFCYVLKRISIFNDNWIIFPDKYRLLFSTNTYHIILCVVELDCSYCVWVSLIFVKYLIGERRVVKQFNFGVFIADKDDVLIV